MVPISLSALLVYISAATGENRGSRFAGNFSRPNRLLSYSMSQALFSPHKHDESPLHTTGLAACGDQETSCAAQGHPEICCPASTACYSKPHGHSPIFCCSLSFHACSANLPLFCPLRTFPCSTSLAGACCPMGLRCASSLCLEYEYKTQAVFSSSLSPETRTGETFMYTLSATTLPAHTVVPARNALSGATAPTYVSPNANCQLGIPGKSVPDLPISDRVLGTPTAWRAKIGEIAVESSASRDCDWWTGCWRIGKAWRNLVMVGFGLFGVAGIMVGL